MGKLDSLCTSNLRGELSLEVSVPWRSRLLLELELADVRHKLISHPTEFLDSSSLSGRN
jgi:hypothetical protein